MKKIDRTEVTHLLAGLLPLMHRKVMRPACQMGRCTLTPLQFIALMLILDQEAKTMTELADKMEVSKQQMTPIVDKLVGAGFVQRSQDAADRRIVKLSVTQGGMEFLDNHLRQVGKSLEERMGFLSETEFAQLDQAVTTLTAICEKME